MYPVSSAFKAALSSSHRFVGTCVVAGVTLVVDPSGSQVVVDRTQQIKRTASLTLIDPTGNLTPSDAKSLLHPLSGNELTVAMGIEYDDGTQETVPQGVFGIKASQVDDTAAGGDLAITVTGADRSYRMSRAKLTNAYPLNAGDNLGTDIQALLSSRVPSTVFNFQAVPYTLPTSLALSPGDDPWFQAQALAAGGGCVADFDVSGAACLKPYPDPTVTPVSWVYQEGSQCTVTKGSRLLTNVGVFNHTVRDGVDANGNPFRGEAMDTNPASATYWLGPYGDVPDYQTSNLWTSQAQAQAVAQADLLAALGSSEAVTLSMFTNPALQDGDVIQVVRGRLHVSSYYVIDTLTLPFSSGTDMQAHARLVAR